jgi:hypothetical protein
LRTPETERDEKKERDMSHYDPEAADHLRRQIKQAPSAFAGDRRGRVLRPDGSADAPTVRRIMVLLVKALEALEDGDIDYAYAAAREAGIELEPPGKP